MHSLFCMVWHLAIVILIILLDEYNHHDSLLLYMSHAVLHVSYSPCIGHVPISSHFFQEMVDINITAASVPVLMVVVLVSGSKKAVVVIFVEKKPLCDVLLLNLPQAMLAASYCFDLRAQRFYQFLQLVWDAGFKARFS